MLKWPDRDTVFGALRQWAENAVRTHSELIRVGCFGSYARGDWGVGSDLDVVLVVTQADQPSYRRAAAFDLDALPVPAEALVYTLEEWNAACGAGGLGARIRDEVVWVYPPT
ncbi:MAG: nucleotidyltransferase domain-containing protein [Bryobacterales bacterium]|nr:nucleotidyltransferase domain-containing protein [Bryobacteraceae bacterium]MDW8353464.1 nucleotidyltransferase domain-containing protein [Bryobacterales bacterium]